VWCVCMFLCVSMCLCVCVCVCVCVHLQFRRKNYSNIFANVCVYYYKYQCSEIQKVLCDSGVCALLLVTRETHKFKDFHCSF